MRSFLDRLKNEAPPASHIVEIEVEPVLRPVSRLQHQGKRAQSAADRADLAGSSGMRRVSARNRRRRNRRHRYPYINCTNCGPRYTVILALPYDRPNTTMKDWPFDDTATGNITIRRTGDFTRSLWPVRSAGHTTICAWRRDDSRRRRRDSQRSNCLTAGKIVAVKGLGGYHLACDARNAAAVAAMRARKFRKEKPFAVMVETDRGCRGTGGTFCRSGGVAHLDCPADRAGSR